MSAYLIAINFPLLVNDVDAEGNPTWGVVSIVLSLMVVAGPVIGTVQALVMRSRDANAYAEIAVRIEQE